MRISQDGLTEELTTAAGRGLGWRLQEAMLGIGDRPALVGGDVTLSGRELEGRTRRVAQGLLSRGAGPGRVVSIRLEDRVEIVIAMISVLRAGSAFCVVPLTYPDPRVQIIHETIEPVYVMDAPIDIATEAASEDVLPFRALDDLAYVIFTSGTTGTPKAVQIPDKGIHYIAGLTELYVGEVIGQLAAMQFDASVFEILGGLLNGMAVRLLDIELLVRPGGDALLNGVGTLFLTTQLFNLLSARLPAALGAVELVIFGGERASARHVRDFLGSTRLLHVYGPTETAIFATAWDVSGDFDENVPIGRPLAGAYALVINDAGQPVEEGEGELLVGGAGVMTGYRKDERATEAAIVTIDGSAYYRTGDLVRVCTEGLLTHLGRSDRQVKVFGFRVDLAEVEAASATLTGVRQVVATHVDGRLRMYFTGSASVLALQAHLRGRLPSHSIPTVQRVSSIPLTPNGKTDLAALALESLRGSALDLLRSTITHVLRLEAITESATFVELGGDSIEAARVAEQLHQVGVQVDLLELLTLPIRSVRIAL
jgi:amino acid adenylation domain-containing protein